MEVHKIWPEKEDVLADMMPPDMRELFADDEEVQKFYLPGKRPNDIAPEEWEKMIEENPIYENNDLPFAITKLGEIVCLEKPKTALSICMPGIRQSGKSLGMYSLADQMKWQWGLKIGFMNEGLGICFDHIHKNKSPFFKKRMQLLTLQPQGLPLVFCYPSSQEVNMQGVHPEFRISIPWKEFFKEPEKFCDLGKSGKYIIPIKKKLINCKNLHEAKAILEMADMPDLSRGSLMGSINELVEHKIFDMGGNGESIFTLKKTRGKETNEYKLHPIIALLKAGLIPCLMTAQLAGSKYEEQVFKFYLWMIWHAKETGEVLRDEPIALFIDELNQVQGNNKEILIKLLREGANMGLGGISVIWCAQNYTDIDPAIRTNTTMGILFKQDGDEARALKKRYNLTDYWMDRLKTLEKFECLLVTEDQFKIYNPTTGEFYFTKEPVLAELLPPLSMHRKELSPQDDYLYEKRKLRLHERILKRDYWHLKDKDGNELFEHGHLTTGTGKKGEAMNETQEITRAKLNIHPLTIYEGDNLKSLYFKKSEQPTEEISYQELIRKGLRIISAPAPIVTEESTHIRVVYLFWPTEVPIPKSARILQTCPSEINILYNNEYDGVLMCGTNCYSFETRRLSGTSDWVGFKKDWLSKYTHLVKKILK